jgi:acetyl/propionyl-CoA carboxylase alpha subunit
MKILVANRGEIAARVFRTAHEMGLETVAVYSDADAGGVHVKAADHAVHIGPSPARQSYLDVENILRAARGSDADLIHPGYGFLSENAGFAEQVMAAGMKWIGPQPETIRLMGDKERARAIAEKAGVPVVPGSSRFSGSDLDGLADAADAVGFPLLVKASAGGGGIGMRRVESPGKLAEIVSSTQSMAQRSFGDDAVFLERFVPKARHIEIQIFGFGDGTAIHLFERDCSLQRRFQKVIEESPAPGLPVSVRERMQDAATALCEHMRYEGAGTVEFIVDADTFEFFFLEMNTRVQVEHPVTEMITGRDIVRMQIEQALGELDSIRQQDIARSGHAIECRLYAERPAKMFMPSPGSLSMLRFPASSETIRVDTGYVQGDAVTPFYDPMIAKIIARGADRDEARRNAVSALRDIDIEGVQTNRQFLIACLEDEQFVGGGVYTGFIDDRLHALTKVDA